MNSSSKGNTNRLLKIGAVIKPHGIKGGMLLNINKKFCVQAGQKIFLNQRDILTGPFEIKSARKHKKFSLVELNGILDMNTAEKFRGYAVGIKIKKLPENFYWTEDLVGCILYGVSGRRIGEVEDVLKSGIHDILVSGELLLPVTKRIIECIDIANKRITVKELPGLLE